jgi:alkylation response protein AidB-like acyl-CoA dehydrogenase
LAYLNNDLYRTYNMTLPSYLADLNRLELTLGDPFDPEQPMSFEQAVDQDERAAFPALSLQFLSNNGFLAYLVPRRWGGKLHSYQHLYHVIRMLARRDVTTSAAYVLHSIGYWAVIIAGNEQQKKSYSDGLLQGHGISWGVTEREFGSDLINNQSTAVEIENGFLLTGAKWPIGMCTRNRHTIFLAKTHNSANPDSFTMFCVDGQQHSSPEYQHLPQEPLYGVRGLDLNGVELKNCFVGPEKIVGEQGKGLELMLRTQQLNRVGVCGLVTGAFDTALRITVSFAEQRKLFGGKLIDIPITRLQLADAFNDLILSELTLHCATRALHFFPKQMFLWGAIVKYLVPDVLDKAFFQLADVVGARYYLRRNFANGMFQKAWRDAGLASFADGNKKVNLKNIALHMEVTLPYLKTCPVPDDKVRAVFAEAFDLYAEVPDAAYSELGVFSGRKDHIFIFLNDSVQRLKEKLRTMNIDTARYDDICRAANNIISDLEILGEEMQAHKSRLERNYNYSPESYLMAQKYSALHAGAVAIHTAVYTQFHEPLANFSWLAGCLDRLRRWNNSQLGFPSKTQIDDAINAMKFMFDKNLAFTPIPLELAETKNGFNTSNQMNLGSQSL